MKIARFEQGGKSCYGELDGEVIHLLSGPLDKLSRVQGAEPIGVGSVKLLAPVTPSKILALGPGHTNMIPAGRQAPERPYLFFKPSSSLANPGDAILFPIGVDNILYELEIAAVIGKRTWRVAPGDALDHLLGYTCCNDVTAGFLDRDWGSQLSYHWKAFDTFAPLGPVVATDLEIAGLAMTSRINGKVHTETSVSLIYDTAELISWISHIMTLNPGDVIALGAAAQASLVVGDCCEIEIEGIGILRNTVERVG